MSGSQGGMQGGERKAELQLVHGQGPPAAYRSHPAALWLKPPRSRDEETVIKKARARGQERGTRKEQRGQNKQQKAEQVLWEENCPKVEALAFLQTLAGHSLVGKEGRPGIDCDSL